MLPFTYIGSTCHTWMEQEPAKTTHRTRDPSPCPLNLLILCYYNGVVKSNETCLWQCWGRGPGPSLNRLQKTTHCPFLACSWWPPPHVGHKPLQLSLVYSVITYQPICVKTQGFVFFPFLGCVQACWFNRTSWMAPWQLYNYRTNIPAIRSLLNWWMNEWAMLITEKHRSGRGGFISSIFLSSKKLDCNLKLVEKAQISFRVVFF